MPTEKLVTSDVVEVLDVKILTSNAHPQIFVLAGETLDSALTKISLQVLDAGQKAAVTAMLTTPSASNPVVLKDDLPTYYPPAFVGSIKDAVDDIVDLPPVGNTTGDIRPVLNENALYRWTGSAWVPYVETGTTDHTQLASQNGDAAFQHLTQAEKAAITASAHSHPNKPILDLITSAGSGLIITTAERARIPTTSEKAALVGTSGTPSLINRYVTSVDPRLNTIKNPYITYGPAGTGATYQGDTITVLNQAIVAIAVGSSSEVKAIEVLPGTYDLNGSGDFSHVIWDDEPEAILIESLVSRSTTWFCQTFSPTIELLGPGTGQGTVRGIVFDLLQAGTQGITIARPNTLIEECTFRSAPGATLAQALKGLIVQAPDCTIRRCNFEGILTVGISVEAERIRIEDCTFSLSSSASLALDVLDAGDYAIVSNCNFVQGTVQVQTNVIQAQFSNCQHTVNSPFVDSGLATRWLSNRPGRFQQAYIGRTRTVGNSSSFADFTGTDQTPFLQAIADPYTKEIRVVGGSNFVFTGSVTLPSGVVIKAASSGPLIPIVVGASGLSPFILSSDSKVEGLSVTSLNIPAFQVSGTQRATVENCTITQSGTDYGIVATGTTDLRIFRCNFTGTRGMSLQTSTRANLYKSVFSTSTATLDTDLASSAYQVKDVIFLGTPAPQIQGTNLIIEGNHFLGTLPTKTGTVTSVWQNNWPSQANNIYANTNNFDGVDTLKLSFGDALEAIPGSGASRVIIGDTGMLAFTETGEGLAATLPIKLYSKINRNLGFTLSLYWTANVFSGNVLWEVTTTFRDRSGLELGSSVVKNAVSTRTQLVFRAEEVLTFTYTTGDYGFIPGVDVTHLSLLIKRLALSPLDTLPGTAYLLEASAILPRD